MNAPTSPLDIYALASGLSDYLATPEGQAECQKGYGAARIACDYFGIDGATAEEVADEAWKQGMYKLLRGKPKRRIETSAEKPSERRDYMCGWCGAPYETAHALMLHESYCSYKPPMGMPTVKERD